MAGHKPNEKKKMMGGWMYRMKKMYGGMTPKKKKMMGGRIQKAMGGAMEVAKPN